MKTAVDWLINEIKIARKSCYNPEEMHIWHTLNVLISKEEEAKEMEKEQIVNAWMDDRFPLDKDWVKQCAEQYYNETYGGNK